MEYTHSSNPPQHQILTSTHSSFLKIHTLKVGSFLNLIYNWVDGEISLVLDVAYVDFKIDTTNRNCKFPIQETICIHS